MGVDSYSDGFNREYTGLAFYDLNDYNLEWIATPKMDVESVTLSKDGKLLVWNVNDSGYSKIYIKNLQTNDILKPNIQKGFIENLRISSDSRKLGFLMSTPTSPFNIYVMDLKTLNIEKIKLILF